MDKPEGKDSLVKIIARFIKYNSRIVFVIFFFTGLIAFAVFGNKGILHRFKLESERKTLEEQLKSEKEKTTMLQKEIQELKTSDTKIEKVAREKYGMTKDGEKIYKVLIDSTK